MMQFVKGASILGFQNMFKQNESTNELHERFAAHMEAEGLSYGTREEYEFRLNIFKAKDDYINYWNNAQDDYRLGHGMFSTMTEKEAEKWMGFTPVEDNTTPVVEFEGDESTLMAVDWRSQGAVNAVKNQGGCGSCWAFGATAGTETAHWKASGKLLNLSEQQLVSCDPKSHGCNGGWHMWAWDYLKSTPQVLQSQYPYKAQTGTCSSSMSSGGIVTAKGYSRASTTVASHKNLINSGVLGIALAAGSSAFQLYKSGVLSGTACGTSINHAVAIVGWGSASGQDYWIVRNSWGSGWGDAGHIKIAAQDGSGVCACQNYSYLVTTN